LVESTLSKAISPGIFEGCGRQPKRLAPSALRKSPALNNFCKPQLDCITENNGHQSNMKEDQVSCA